MPSYVSLIVTVVALGLMYAVCLRPMRRGQGHCATSGARRTGDVQRLREELDQLRREHPAAGEGLTR